MIATVAVTAFSIVCMFSLAACWYELARIRELLERRGRR